MFINNRLASLVYKICIVVVCLFGLLASSGLLNGTFQFYVLLYYTTLCSLFCLVFYGVSIFFTARNIKNTGKYGVVKFAPHFKGGVVMANVLTMLLYFFTLASGAFVNVSFFAVFSNIVVHIVVPIMVIVDWALFDRKGRFTGSDPIIWSVIPFTYYAIVLIAAQAGVEYYGNYHYPYRFINPEMILWAPVLVNVFLLTLAYVAVGYILLGVDRLLGNYAKRKALDAAYMLPDVEAMSYESSETEEDFVQGDDLRSLSDLLETGPQQQDQPGNAAPPAGQPVPPTPAAQPQPAQPPQQAQPAQRPTAPPRPGPGAG